MTTVNILIGPPSNPDDCNKMLNAFFKESGKHIVCGGTTSKIAAKFLNKPVKASFAYIDTTIPPISEIEGIDLVTEGCITINRVLEYARDFTGENVLYNCWKTQADGASQIARLLFEDTENINLFVGRAVNPAHQTTSFPINFNAKMQIIEELSACLIKMGKKTVIIYF